MIVQPISKTYSTGTRYSLRKRFCFPFPSLGAALCFLSVNGAALRTSFNRHRLSFCDWLVSPHIISSSFIHIVTGLPSLLRVNTILLYVHTTFCLSVHLADTRFALPLGCGARCCGECAVLCRYLKALFPVL